MRLMSVRHRRVVAVVVALGFTGLAVSAATAGPPPAAPHPVDRSAPPPGAAGTDPIVDTDVPGPTVETLTGTVGGDAGGATSHPVVVDEPALLRLTLHRVDPASEPASEVVLSLDDPTGTTVARTPGRMPTGVLLVEAATPGTWHAGLRAAAGATGYTLTVERFTLPTFATRATVMRGEVGPGSRSAVHPLPVAAGSRLKVVLRWPDRTADLDLAVRGPAGTRGGQARSALLRPEVAVVDALGGGTWAFTVRARRGSSAYTLRVTVADQPAGLLAADVAASSGIDTTPTLSWRPSVADVDADGRDDLLFNRHWEAPATLYRNTDAGFVRDAAGSFSTSDRHDCAWGDVDRDGDLDVYCTVGANLGDVVKRNELWLQQPDGTFADAAEAWGVTDPLGRGRAAVLFDVDNDGWLDLFVGNSFPRNDGQPSSNRLWRNDGGRQLVPAPELGVDTEVGGRCAQAGDYDRDGWTDLLLCGQEHLVLLRNDAGRGFVDVTAEVGLVAWAADAVLADVNGDGRLDVVDVTPAALRERLNRAGRYGRVTVVRALTGGAGLAVGDASGDGRPDLFVVQADPAAPDMLLINDGSGRRWTDVPLPAAPGGLGEAAAALDADADGLDDFVVTNGAERVRGVTQLLTMFGVPQDPAVRATDDSATLRADRLLPVRVLDNDSPGFVPALVAVLDAPASGTAAVQPNGAIAYEPAEGWSGSDRLVYSACDRAGACDTATVAVTVEPSPAEPPPPQPPEPPEPPPAP